MTGNQRFALVTGGGSGIGRAAALALHASGFRVALAGRRGVALDQTNAMAGGAMLPVTADVSRPDSVDALFALVKREFGRLDLLFNNAGQNAPGVAIEDMPFETWSAIVGVNLTGAFLCAQAAYRMMKEQTPRGGRIINNGSISAISPRPNQAPYAATKHAITGLTKSISLDGRKHDIACSQIDIGNAETELTQRMTEGVLQADGRTAVEPRIDVAHVARAVVYVASLPLEANVQFMMIMATKMPFVGRG